jgi:hypothetical protein
VGAYQGAARLEWWANAATCLATYDVTVALESATDEPTTTGTGRVDLDSDADIEAFAWLCNLDPVFLLCLPHGREVAVVVEPAEHDQRQFSISDYGGPPQREITATFSPEP